MDREAEASARALITGAAIGALLAIANVYMGLATGWNDSGNITASLLGFALLSSLARRQAVSPRETNIVQATATAAAAMAFAVGLVGPVPALAMLHVRASLGAFALWGIGISTAGIAAGHWMAARLFAGDTPPFPTSVATAAVIRSCHASVAGAMRRARRLFASAAVAGAVTWFRDGAPSWIPTALLWPGRVGGVDARALGLGVGLSPMMLGAGMLVGVRLAASVALGGVVAWALLAPALVRRGVLGGAVDYEHAVAWMLWPAVAAMVAGGATSLLREGGSFARALRALWARGGARHDVTSATHIRTASIVFFVGAGVATATAIGLLRVPPLLALAAVVAAVALSYVGARAAGETDVNPSTPLGQVSQLAYGAIAPGGVVADVVAGGTVTALSTQTTTTLWALKCGARLGADPRLQLRAQLLGSLVGLAVVVPAYGIVVRAYGVGTRMLPAPAALAYRAIAETAASGAVRLPAGGGVAVAVTLVVAIVLAALPRRIERWAPSPTAMAVGMVIPATYATTMLLGACVGAIVAARRPRFWEEDGVGVASGAIAGEAVVGVVCAVLVVAGLLRR